MLENYFQQIESIITPIGYSRSNVKTQLLSEDLEQFKHTKSYTNDYVLQEKINISGKMSPIGDFNAEKQDRISKMRKETEGKLENPDIMTTLYQNDHESYVDNHTASIKKPRSKSTKHYDINSLSSNDIQSLMEKIQALSCKNMNYRYTNEKLKRKVAEIEKDNQQLREILKRNEIEKEKANAYLLKLESLLHNNYSLSKSIGGGNNTMCATNENKYVISLHKKNNSKNISAPLTNKTSFYNPKETNNTNSPNNYNQTNNFSFSFGSLDKAKIDLKRNGNIIFVIEDNQPIKNNEEDISHINNVSTPKEIMRLSSPSEIKSFIQKLIKEYSKLKRFQSNVYLISTKYDDINEHLRESLNSLQTNDLQSNEIHKHYEEIIHKVDEALQTKQQEYNLLLLEKEDQINVLKEQLITISNENEQRKKDRVKEQIILQDHENQIGTLKEQLGYLSDYGEKPNESPLNKNTLTMRHNVLSNISEQQQCNKILLTKVAKRIEPAQKTVKNLLYKIEREFNLNDRNTAHFLGTLTKKFKP